MTLAPFDLDRIGTGLVVSAAQQELTAAAATGAMVVTAPPGTGKTTVVPPLIANLLASRVRAGGADPGRVLLTQPRRVAARAAAHRLAALTNTAVGGPVGFTVRGERQVGAGTRIEALTPGVLLRRLLADPELTGVGAIVLDEVHERSVEGDLLLGMIAEVRQLRDDLLVVAMSATLDADGLAALLGERSTPAPVVRIPSVLHPLRVDYAPHDESRVDERGVTRSFLAHTAQTAARAREAEGCDALVFLPGVREVDEVVRLLRAECAPGSAEVLALHGRVAPREQDRAVRGREPGDPPRIVVSTSLAESSLTVPGVRLVVDAGLAREVRRDRGREMSGLVTVSASRASAEQRAGRAARQGPGRAIRLFSEADFARMPQASLPEIASADLVDAALLLAAWGTPAGRGLALLTAPPPAAMDSAVAVLRALELVDSAGTLTEAGAAVSRLPLGVREARALIAGSQLTGDAAAVAEVVAAFADDHRDAGADLPRLLRELRTGRAAGARRWRRESDRLARLAPAPHSAGTRPRDATRGADEGSLAGLITALARPDWIARRVADRSRGYLLASGTRAALPEGSGLLGADWLAVREVQLAAGRAADGTGAVIRLAAPLAEAEALRIGTALTTERRTAQVEGGRVRVRQERHLGAIPLAAVAVAATREDTAPALAAHVREAGLGALDWDPGAVGLRHRLGLLRREIGDPWPAMDDASLLHCLETWLGPDLERLRPDAALTRVDTEAALRRLLPWPDAARLDTLAPERLAVPSGSTARIEYPDPTDPGAAPIIAVKLQEVFGLAETPRVLDGRVPLVFHLLSPARKPLAVTSDLASFWNGPYQEVRKEMRGRYPKHPWPEDPWTAPATARTTRGSRRP